LLRGCWRLIEASIALPVRVGDNSPREGFMSTYLSRRGFLRFSSGLSTLGLPTLGTVHTAAQETQAGAEGPVSPTWPQHDPAVVAEMVGVCHGDVKRVRELLERQPALANAAFDWGFGDWEDALGAAAHTGRREIADLLLASGARPSIFCAAMLGQLDVVRALVAARPGVQRTHGPHGITLLMHARAGGPDAEPVVKYLETLGDADRRLTTAALDTRDRDLVVGRYEFGPGTRDRLDIDVRNDQLGITRPGATRRFLLHTGDLTFFPSGVPSVKIAFAREGGRVTKLTVADPAGFVTARRL
jgi:hypothetical protein